MKKRKQQKKYIPDQPQRTKKISLGKIINALAARSLVARYDALKRDPLRKQPTIRTEYSETEQIFDAQKRLLAYAVCDDLYDNSSIGATIDTCIRLTIGTKGGNAIFTGDDKDFWQAEFNQWKRHCGYEEGENLQEILSQILRIVKIHGDCIVWMDAAETGGKLRVFDADQICNISDFDQWKSANGLDDDCRQVEGVVITATGQVIGYFVTMERNRTTVNSEDALFLAVDDCRRISYRKKHSQYRGEPSILANQQITEDTDDLLKSEIAASKLSAEMPLVIEQPPAAGDDALDATLEGFSAQELSEAQIDTAAIETIQEAVDYAKTFEAFSGKSSIATVANGTKVSNLANVGRPSTQIQSWVDLLNDTNGKALGVMSCLSRGRADNSYSSGQIELSISWASFEQDQKLLERGVIDYVCGKIAPHQPYFVQWAKEFEIDPEKSERVVEAKLKAGLTTYRAVLGVDWEEQLQQLAQERKRIEELGLTNLTFFQTCAGAQLPTNDIANNDIEEDISDDEDSN